MQDSFFNTVPQFRIRASDCGSLRLFAMTDVGPPTEHEERGGLGLGRVDSPPGEVRDGEEKMYKSDSVRVSRWLHPDVYRAFPPQRGRQSCTVTASCSATSHLGLLREEGRSEGGRKGRTGVMESRCDGFINQAASGPRWRLNEVLPTVNRTVDGSTEQSDAAL